jgi:hypothetical protein
MAEGESSFLDGVSLGSLFMSVAIFTIEWGFLHGGYVQSESAFNFIKGLTDPLFTAFGATKPAANDMQFSFDENGMPISMDNTGAALSDGMSSTANQAFGIDGMSLDAANDAVFSTGETLLSEAANDSFFNAGEMLLSLAA